MDKSGRFSVHPVTLSFKSRQLQLDFIDYQTRRSLKLTRWVLIFGALLYLVYSFLDRYLVPETADTILIIRLSESAFMLGILAISYTKYIFRVYQLLVTMVPLIAGLGILSMILISGTEGSIYYYAGLILTIMFAHGLLGLRFIYATIVTWFIVLIYEFYVLASDTTPVLIGLNNSFFLISANIIGMFTSYSLEYYMRFVFWQNSVLKQKSEQLEAEIGRKSQELSRARQIQLAMLPQKIPFHDDFELSVSMHTAMEIGGDYYDFFVDDNGILTFAFGDATGHGAQAGAMVTATKFLFANYAAHLDLIEFLNNASRSLRQMRLPRLYMALAIGRIHNRILEIAGAGLPPLLLCRNEANTIEEIQLKGIPLGGYGSGNYQKYRLTLAPGDSLVMMTDGFPELMNASGEELGYARIIDVFKRTACETAARTINSFVSLATSWTNGFPQNDDITFLAIKMKDKNTIINKSN